MVTGASKEGELMNEITLHIRRATQEEHEKRCPDAHEWKKSYFIVYECDGRKGTVVAPAPVSVGQLVRVIGEVEGELIE